MTSKKRKPRKKRKMLLNRAMYEGFGFGVPHYGYTSGKIATDTTP